MWFTMVLHSVVNQFNKLHNLLISNEIQIVHSKYLHIFYILLNEENKKNPLLINLLLNIILKYIVILQHYHFQMHLFNLYRMNISVIVKRHEKRIRIKCLTKLYDFLLFARFILKIVINSSVYSIFQ